MSVQTNLRENFLHGRGFEPRSLALRAGALRLRHPDESLGQARTLLLVDPLWTGTTPSVFNVGITLINMLGAIHKLRHTNFMIFYPSPLVTGGHISETPPT